MIQIWDTLYVDSSCMNISLMFKIARTQMNPPQRATKYASASYSAKALTLCEQ